MNPALLAVVGLYAVLCVVILSWLTMATGGQRRRHRVLLGDGGVAPLARVMRGHANAVEAMPIFLVLLTIAAGLGAAAAVLHAIGVLFVAGRALHAWHFTRDDAPLWQRAAGFGASALAILVAGGVVLVLAIGELT